jgi:hypothetical protein
MSLTTRTVLLAIAIGLVIYFTAIAWTEPDVNAHADSIVASAKVSSESVDHKSQPSPSEVPVQVITQSTKTPEYPNAGKAANVRLAPALQDYLKVLADEQSIERVDHIRFDNVFAHKTRKGWSYELQGISPAAAEHIRQILNESKPRYWQISIGSVTVGRIYQSQRGYLAISLGVGTPRLSFQKGVYEKFRTVQNGVALNATIGGWPFKVNNKTLVSYTTDGFSYCGGNCWKINSVGDGSPQLSVSLTLTIQTN